jgi:hypothetical protein
LQVLDLLLELGELGLDRLALADLRLQVLISAKFG